MKECINCKTQLEDDELFCHECGTKQEIEEVNAQDEEVLESGGKKCIPCGETIEDDSLFCPFCGKPQDVEDVKDEEPQKEVEKEESQQEPVEPESLQEPEEEVPQQETVEQESLQEPEEEEPLQEPVEPEQTQTDEQDTVPPPQPESSEQLEQPKQSEQPEEPEAEEQPTYERVEKKKSRKWLWILLALLIAGAAGWYFFIQDSENTSYEPQVDTDMIEEVADSVYDDEAMDDDMPTDEQDFLKDFYRGEYINEEYVSRNVTPYVLNKLKRDAEMYGQSGRLAVWVFDAYTTGTDDADHEYEQGPLILQTNEADKFCIIYQFNYYDEPALCRARKVFLTVTKEDGQFLISDYEVVADDYKKDMQDADDLESQMMSPSENTHEASSNSIQDKQEYTAMFAFGTIEELRKYGVITDNGEFGSNFDKHFFTQIDIRIEKVIKLYSKSAKILTPHPTNAYTLKPDENQNYVLTITNPQLFWSTSKYLVIVVK